MTSCHRLQREEAERIGDSALTSYAEHAIDNEAKLGVHFDGKIMKQHDPAERTVQLAQDRISTVRSEEAFQQVVLTVDEMRRLSEGFKRNNFTKAELMSVVRKLLAA